MFNLPPTKRNKFGIRGIGLGDSKVKPYKVSFSRNGVKISSKSFRTLNEAVYVRWRLEEHYWDKIAVSRHFDSFAPYINQLSTDQQSDADEYLKQVFEKYDKVFPGFLPEKE